MVSNVPAKLVFRLCSGCGHWSAVRRTGAIGHKRACTSGSFGEACNVGDQVVSALQVPQDGGLARSPVALEEYDVALQHHLARNLLQQLLTAEEDFAPLMGVQRAAGDVRAAAEIAVSKRVFLFVLDDVEGQLDVLMDCCRCCGWAGRLDTPGLR